MFRSKNPKIEFVAPQFYKDWAHADAEIERLGQRLDAVRGIIRQLEDVKTPENHWGLRHWRDVEAIVLRRWKHTVRLKDVGLRQVSQIDDRPEVDYSWWEPSDGIVGPMFAWMNFDWLNGWFNQVDLTRSWENAREEKLQKARKGLA